MLTSHADNQGALPHTTRWWWCCSVTKSCPTLCDPMDCSPPGFSVHGIPQARILEWDCHLLLRGIFPNRGSDSHLLHWQVCPLPLSHLGRTLWDDNAVNRTPASAMSSPDFLLMTFSISVAFYPHISLAFNLWRFLSDSLSFMILTCMKSSTQVFYRPSSILFFFFFTIQLRLWIWGRTPRGVLLTSHPIGRHMVAVSLCVDMLTLLTRMVSTL